MTVAFITQPTYLPWCGYFAAIDQADVCVLLDTVQFSRQSWQQRNRVRLPNGNVVWLTVPVSHGHSQLQDVRIDNGRPWQRKHWGTIEQAYSRTPGWDYLSSRMRPLYDTDAWLRESGHDFGASNRVSYDHDLLADLTSDLVYAISVWLGITTPIVRASELGSTRAGRIERLADLLALVDADTLLEPRSGTYLEHAPFEVKWFDYQPQPYEQAALPWCPYLSVVDVLAYHGPSAALTIIREGVQP